MKISKRLVSLISIFLIMTLVAVLALPGMGMRAHAAGGSARAQRKTGYVRFEVPEVREIGPIPLETSGLPVMNSTNFNYDVEVGRHYGYLDETGKNLYRAILVAARHVYMYNENLEDYAGTAYVAKYMPSKYQFSDQQIIDAQEAAAYDYPELAQLIVANLYSMVETYVNPSTNEQLYSTYFVYKNYKYNISREQYNQMANQVAVAREEYLRQIGNPGRVSEIELAVHDKLISENVYSGDQDAQVSGKHIAHTAWAALVDHESVCDGYASAFAYVLEGFRIESLVITGQVKQPGGGGGHAWNIVKLGGQWYEVDSTWDDVNDPDETHNYFNITTDEISSKDGSTRSRDGFSRTMPTATGTTYTYAFINGGGAEVPVTGLSWNQDNITVKVGVDGDFTAKVLPENATDPWIDWSSSDKTVLVVADDGHYTPLKTGNCTVTAGVYVNGNIVSKTCYVTVVENSAFVHTVYFDLNGGSGTADPIKLSEGDEYGTLPLTVERKDYLFDGWYTASTGGLKLSEKTIFTATTDITLYAQWIKKNFASGEAKYEVNESGEAIVKSGKNKKIKKLVIGDTTEQNGKSFKVTEIAKGAFKGYKKLTSVKLGRNIKKIGAGAFKGCSNVKKFTIYGNNLKTVGSGSFKGLKKGVKIKIVCKDKKTYKKIVKKLEKAGAKDAKFTYKKGK